MFGRDATTAVAFFFVGAGCGFFPFDALLNLVINEGSLPNTWVGELFFIQGITGLSMSGLFFVSRLLFPGQGSLRAGQAVTMGLITLTVSMLLVLALFWDVGAPHFPVVVVVGALCEVVVSVTYFLVYPMITMWYGGWLVAPLRVGTDVSTFFTAMMGEVQNPSGSQVLFPSWVLLLGYAALAAGGLVAWILIVRFGIGLRPLGAKRACDEEAPEPAPNNDSCDDDALSEVASTAASETASTTAGAAGEAAAPSKLRSALSAIACPRALLLFVVVGTLTDVLQWGVVASFSEVGAMMTDPAGCHGARGPWVYRTSLTANRVLLPLGAALSARFVCSRRIFKLLCVLQVLAVTLMLLAVFGVGRELWTTPVGQGLYIASYALVGGLEGYLLTMAYRLIGDAEDVDSSLRHSATCLMGLLNGLLTCLFSLVSGYIASEGIVACRAP